jgi:hypothetical protein
MNRKIVCVIIVSIILVSCGVSYVCGFRNGISENTNGNGMNYHQGWSDGYGVGLHDNNSTVHTYYTSNETGWVVPSGVIGITEANGGGQFIYENIPESRANLSPVITQEPTSTPIPTPSYVTCSDYQTVSDKWKTPTGSYVKLGNTPIGLFGDNYDEINIGESAKQCVTTRDPNPIGYTYYFCESALVGGESVRLKRVSESESGYRDACMVVEE